MDRRQFPTTKGMTKPMRKVRSMRQRPPMEMVQGITSEAPTYQPVPPYSDRQSPDPKIMKDLSVQDRATTQKFPRPNSDDLPTSVDSVTNTSPAAKSESSNPPPKNLHEVPAQVAPDTKPGYSAFDEIEERARRIERAQQHHIWWPGSAGDYEDW